MGMEKTYHMLGVRINRLYNTFNLLNLLLCLIHVLILQIVRWKFPGGLSNFGEDIPDTAVREVWEETGIKTGKFTWHVL